jgi:crossover junction endodeoxyribonuclease RusA
VTCATLPQELSSSEALSPVGLPTEHAEASKITLVLPVLSANLYWTVIRIGQRASIGVTSRAKAYKRQVGFLAMAAGVRKPLDGRLAMTIDFYPHRPQDWAKRSRLRPDDWADTVQAVDLGNVEKVLSDALNNVVWFDDKQLHDIHLRRHDPDEKGERLVVTVTPIVRPRIAPELSL